jgi:hypothetical protein
VKFWKYLVFLQVMHFTSCLKRRKLNLFTFMSTRAVCRTTRDPPSGINRMAVRGGVWSERRQLVVDKGSGLRSVHFSITSYIFHVSVHLISFCYRLSTERETLRRKYEKSLGRAQAMAQAVVAGLALRRLGFHASRVRVAFVMGRVVLRHVSIRITHQCATLLFGWLSWRCICLTSATVRDRRLPRVHWIRPSSWLLREVFV